MVTEDRGRRVAIHHKVDAEMKADGRVNVIREARGLAYREGRWVIGSAILVFIALVMVGVRLSPLSEAMRGAIYYGVGIPGSYALVWCYQRVMTPRRAKYMVLRGVCGACVHDMTGIPVEQDGYRVCPECGAAWRWDGGGGAR